MAQMVSEELFILQLIWFNYSRCLFCLSVMPTDGSCRDGDWLCDGLRQQADRLCDELGNLLQIVAVNLVKLIELWAVYIEYAHYLLLLEDWYDNL